MNSLKNDLQDYLKQTIPPSKLEPIKLGPQEENDDIPDEEVVEAGFQLLNKLKKQEINHRIIGYIVFALFVFFIVFMLGATFCFSTNEEVAQIIILIVGPITTLFALISLKRFWQKLFAINLLTNTLPILSPKEQRQFVYMMFEKLFK